MVTTFSSASSFRAKCLAGETGLAHIDHDEHAAFGHAGGDGFGALEARHQGAGAALVAPLHGIDFGEVIVDGEGCRILEEGLGAEEHGFGERQWRASQNSSEAAIQPQRKPGMAWDFDTDETTTVRFSQARLIEGRGEYGVAIGQRGIDLIGDDPQVMVLADSPILAIVFGSEHRPVGLLGVLSRRTRVFGVIARSRSAALRWKP